MWRLGSFDELQAGGSSEKLIGIAIEYPKRQNALIGVRILCLTESLIHWYPDLGTLLPRPKNVRVNVTSARCA